MSARRAVLAVLAGLSFGARFASAQGSASGKPADVLPPDVAHLVDKAVAAATERGLSAKPLESRALRLAAKGAATSSITRAVDDHLARMLVARDVLTKARSATPTNEEIDASAEAMRSGLDAAKLDAFARRAPAQRSISVPMLAIASLIDGGITVDSALRAVSTRIAANGSDAEVNRLAVMLPAKGPVGALRRAADASADASVILSPSEALADKQTSTPGATTPSGDGKKPTTTPSTPPAPKSPPATPTTTVPKQPPATPAPTVPKPAPTTPPTTTPKPGTTTTTPPAPPKKP